MKNICSFTMTELLIVATLICLLTGVLMSALTDSLDRAKLNACSNNLRCIGQSVHWYCSDNQGFIPPVYPVMDKNSTVLLRMPDNRVSALGLIIGEYVENAYIFGCPDSPGYRENDVAGAWQSRPMVLSAYLYRGKCNNFKSKLHDPENFRKPYAMDFAFISDQNRTFAPHSYLAVNILYTDCHVKSHRNSKEPFKYFTLRTLQSNEIMPDCTKLWKNADLQRKNR